MNPTFKLELTEDECSMLHFLVDENRTVCDEPFDRTLNEFAVGLKEDLKCYVELVKFNSGVDLMMPKYFLLTAGDLYYPCSGDVDWQGFYETYEQAKSQVTSMELLIPCDYGDTHKMKYTIMGNTFDWYEIIDLTHRIN